MSTHESEAIHQLHRKEFGRLVATLTRLTGDLGLAEDAVQDAFAKAITQWNKHPPDNPIAWLARVARNSSLDRMRRDKLHTDKMPELLVMSELESTPAAELPDHPALRDDMLRLIFTCCHPSLNIEAQVGLSLRTICGLTTTQIASAFITPVTTMAARLTRAQQKIKSAGIAYRIPEPDELRDRINGVLAVVYLIFNEAYLSATGSGRVREDVAGQALYLGRLLCTVLSEKSEAQALLALMLFQHSRRNARFDQHGRLVLLSDQNRTLWDQDNICEGKALIHQVFDAGAGNTTYAIQAAIAALHADAESAKAVDWNEVCNLYEYLTAIDPSPVVALNHAVAIGERDGAAAGLHQVEQLQESSMMQRYYLYHSARADLLMRDGQLQASAAAYSEALKLVGNDSEREFLRGRLESVTSTSINR